MMPANGFNPLLIQDPNASSGNPLLGGTPSLGQAVTTTGSMLGDWLAQQRAKSIQMGFLDPNTGLPTSAGIINAAQQYGNALVLGTGAPEGAGITAYHGSPYSFERFDPAKIGTGEGAQAYGHGLYFAESEPTAEYYRKTLAGSGPSTSDIQGVVKDETGSYGQINDAIHIKSAANAYTNGGDLTALAKNVMARSPNMRQAVKDDPSFMTPFPTMERIIQRVSGLDQPGSMYQVNLQADPEHFLDWDKPLSEQSQHVQDALKAWDARQPAGQQVPTLVYGQRQPGAPLPDFVEPSGKGIYQHFSAVSGNDFAAGAQALQSAGIPGIRYLDQGSRASGEGTSNYVVFNPDIIDIIRKYGIAGLIGGGTAAATATGNGQQPQQ